MMCNGNRCVRMAPTPVRKSNGAKNTNPNEFRKNATSKGGKPSAANRTNVCIKIVDSVDTNIINMPRRLPGRRA